jgi:GR25 family glycosyltransferase involved in LPS biosynthesis
MIRIAYADFWYERKGDMMDYDDINHMNTVIPTDTTRELIPVKEGVGLFHINKLKKDFNGIVNGIVNGIANDIVLTDIANADIIICSCFGTTKDKFPNKTKIFLGYENSCKQYVEKYEYSFSSFATTCNTSNNYNLGLSFIYYGFPLYKKLQEPRPLVNKTKFCICIISNDSESFRKEFIKKLTESTHRRSIDCYGKLFKNKTSDIIDKTSWYNPAIFDIIKEYKFMICMENSQVENYWTEKLVNGYIGNTIPIYWGDPNITDIFNSKSFININTLGVERGIELIKELDSNDMMYNDMYREPAIISNKYDKYYHEDYYKNYMTNIFQKVLDQRKLLAEIVKNNFKKRLVINLDRRPDRYKDFCQSCPFDSSIVERVSGVDGRALPEALPLEALYKDYNINNGAIGCFLSHRKTWEIISRNDSDDSNEFSIVFEDDITFCDNFSVEIHKLVSQLQTLKESLKSDDAILCYISGRFFENYVPLRYEEEYSKTSDNLYLRPNNKYLTTRINTWKRKVKNADDVMLTWERCTSCLIMNKRAAEILVRLTEKIPDIPIDTFLFKLNSYTNIIKFYDYFPHLCYSPYGYKSDIRK